MLCDLVDEPDQHSAGGGASLERLDEAVADLGDGHTILIRPSHLVERIGVLDRVPAEHDEPLIESLLLLGDAPLVLVVELAGGLIDTRPPRSSSSDGLVLGQEELDDLGSGDTVSEDIECANGGALELLTSEVPEPIPDHMVLLQKRGGGVTV